MPCFLVLIALTAPRLLILVLWFLTTWFAGMFASILWPILGFLIAPTTLLWYSAVQHWFAGTWSFWPLVGLIFALMIDFSPASGRRKKERKEHKE